MGTYSFLLILWIFIGIFQLSSWTMLPEDKNPTWTSYWCAYIVLISLLIKIIIFIEGA